jgi:phenylacetate-CoA ligase
MKALNVRIKEISVNYKKIFFKYFVYYPVIFIRGEWIFSHYKKLLGSQYESQSNIEKLQLRRLIKLSSYAKENIPYYRNILKKDISSFSDLQETPFLEKDALRIDAGNLIPVKPSGRVRSKTTGGSTGAAVTIYKNNYAMAEELAATWRGYSWAGVEIGDLQARFWGVPFDKKSRLRAKLVDWVTNRIRLSAFSFSDNDIANYVVLLNKKKPVYFYGYVSMIKQLADYLDKNNIPLNFKLQAVITTSEVLSVSDRIFFEHVFKCKVFNEYGCGEIGTIAHECEHGKMHITAENMIIEIVDANGHMVEPGVSGEIVVTDLTNYSMPLIRYKMRDFGVIDREPCQCGRGLPVLKEIHGREYDLLINSKGEKFHGEFFLYMIEDAKKLNMPVRGYQIEQVSLNKMIVNVVADDLVFYKVKDFLEDKIKLNFDSSIEIEFNQVSFISREASGKLRVIKRLF